MLVNRRQKGGLYSTVLVIVSIFFSLSAIISSYFVSKLTDAFSGGKTESILFILSATVLFLLLSAAMEYLYLMIKGRLGIFSYDTLIRQVEDKLLRISADSSIFSSSGDIYSRVSSDLDEYIDYKRNTFPSLIYQGIRLIMVIAAMLILDYRIALVYIIAASFSVILQDRLSKGMDTAGLKLKKSSVSLDITIRDIVRNRMTIKIFQAEKFADNYIDEEGNKMEKASVTYAALATPMKIAGIFIGLVPVFAMSLAGISRIQSGTLALSTFLSIYYLCDVILSDQLHFAELFMTRSRAMIAKKRLVELFELPVEVRVLSYSDGSAVLENVCFSYGIKQVLSDISLTIKNGEKIAFIGESGSGKSTAIKILAGFLKPQGGICRLSKTAYVSQFPYFFTESVRYNLVSSDKTEEDEYAKALKTADADFITGRPEQLLTENAKNLSGGEKQRLAMARALLADSSLILFDESFSALDAVTASDVISKILTDYKEKSMVFILHQKELLLLMDKIYVFKNGNIIAEGSYEEIKEVL